MTRKEKDLVLHDLCARLPYGVCAELLNHHLVKHIYSIKSISMENGWTTGVLECAGRKKIYSAKIEDVKPYLRPMSSMTEEEQREFQSFFPGSFGNQFLDVEEGYIDIYECPSTIRLYLYDSTRLIEWLNKKMFDYRGLIPAGLAISTETFNPYKN